MVVIVGIVFPISPKPWTLTMYVLSGVRSFTTICWFSTVKSSLLTTYLW